MEWDDEAREAFRELFARRRAREIADEIPADQKTVYRIYNGETSKPSRAVQRGIERILEDESREAKP